MALQQHGGLNLSSRTAGNAPSEDSLRQAAYKALRQAGFSEFRGSQEAAVLAALHGQDCFVLMPTGGGKSACYTLPALARPGTVTLVISPLIALMEDQVAGLRARGVAADYLSSTRSEGERRRVLAGLSQRPPATQVLFVTPELLSASDSFIALLRDGLYASGLLLLLAVDEAHCISSWGHDFRSAYRRLGALRRELPRAPIMALTATASRRVEADIIQQLRLRAPLVLRSSFDRPNIHLSVRYLDVQRGAAALCTDALPALLALLREEEAAPSQGGGGGGDGAAIIYCHKRDDCDRVAAAVTRMSGRRCAAYHAGLPDSVRSAVLADWQGRRLHHVAATVAWGMGIDRPDVRLVVHLSLPKSIEGYYQEMGRAGRDGLPARSVVFYATKDRQGLEYLLERSAKEAKGGGRRGRPGGGEGGGGEGGGGDGDGVFGPVPRAELEAFGHVVDMCLAPSCRRAAVLSFFDEGAPAGRVRCCDACDAPAAVAEAVRKAQRVGLERRQRFAGGKHLLDFGGGGGGTRMEFERHPGEGLEYDGEGSSRALQESDEEGGEEPGMSAQEAAAAAAKRARAEGRSVVGALAWAEAAAAQGAGSSSKARLLAKLDQREGAATATQRRRAASTAEASVELRARVAAQLASALAANVALSPALAAAGLGAAAAAAAVEEACFGGAATKAAYQQAAASALVRARTAADLAKLPVLGSADGHAEERSAAGGPEIRAAEQELMHCVAAAERAAAAAAEGGPEAAESAAQAVELLHSLRNASVSVTLLQATGAGKRLARLKKSASEGVAAAAAEVVSMWKAAVVGP